MVGCQLQGVCTAYAMRMSWVRGSVKQSQMGVRGAK